MSSRVALVVVGVLGGVLAVGCGGRGGGGGNTHFSVADAQAVVESKFPGHAVRHTKTTQGDLLVPTRHEFQVAYRTGTEVSVSTGGTVHIRGPVPLELVPEGIRRDAKTVLTTADLGGASMQQSDQWLNLSHHATYTLFVGPEGKAESSIGFHTTGRVVSAGGVPYPWVKVTPALIAQADERHRRNPFHAAATWSSAKWSRHTEDLLGKGGDRLTLFGTDTRGKNVSVEVEIPERTPDDLGLAPRTP